MVELVEHVEHSLMESYTDRVALRRFHPCLRVFDVLQGEIKFTFVILLLAAKLRLFTVRQYTQEWDSVPVIKRQYPVGWDPP